jgi:prephenate dehydratase
MVKVGFLGAAGSHSEVSVAHFFSNMKSSSRWNNGNHTSEGFSSLISLLESVADKKLTFAFIPIENTTSGTFVQSCDLLIKYNHKVFINAEWIVHEENCLMVAGNSIVKSLDDIEEIYSHPHILEQCSDIIEECKKATKNLVVHGSENSALAIETVKGKNLLKAAVIASPYAAKHYNMRILKSKVENDCNSCTRYFIVSHLPCTSQELSSTIQTNKNKTSIAVLLRNSPNSLVRSLSVFSFRDINISKIESRPSYRSLSGQQHSSASWEYINFIDIEGSIVEEKVMAALTNLREYSIKLWNFGSYTKYVSLESEFSYPVIGN